MRLSSLVVVLLAFSFSALVKAGSRTLFWNAKVEALDPKTNTITVVAEPHNGTNMHKAEVIEKEMRKQLANGRKVKASFADLKKGQRVKITILWSRSFSSSNLATSLLILNSAGK